MREGKEDSVHEFVSTVPAPDIDRMEMNQTRLSNKAIKGYQTRLSKAIKQGYMCYRFVKPHHKTLKTGCAVDVNWSKQAVG